MGEMIKFGIKLAMIVAAAIGLTAALLTLFQLLISTISSMQAVGFVLEMIQAVAVVLPFNMTMIMTAVTAMMSFRISYWMSDKMIELIGSTS